MNTDPIADLLTRLRNASMARHEHTRVRSSKIKKEMLKLMERKELIKGFKEITDQEAKFLDIALHPGKLLSLKRVSKPGQRIYKKSTELFPVLRGYGFAIISTSHGIMTGDEARKKGIGGELICEAS